MQSDAERTLSNLHVLGALSDNDKLVTNDDSFDIYGPTSLRAIWRFIKGEGRAGNVQRVRTCVRNAMSFASTFLEDVNTMLDHCHTPLPPADATRLRVKSMCDQHHRMMAGLAKAQTGMQHLLLTYRDDPAMAAQVSLLIEEVDTFLQTMNPFSEALQRRYDATSAQEETERKSPQSSVRNPAPPPGKSERKGGASPT